LREVHTIGATRRLNAHRVFSLLVSFGALIGWSGLAYSTGASANVQRELRAELAQVKAGQERLLSERHQQQAALEDLTQVQSKLVAARAELASLSQKREQVSTQVVAVRQELTVFAKRLADKRASKASRDRLAEQSSKPARGQSEPRPKT